jgi:alpha-beta hydrolase superfamily lysophospholipase
VGDADRIALPAASVQFYESARSPVKRLRRFPGMLHELLREKGREQVFEEIVGWVRSRVDQPGTGAAIALGSSDAPS